MFKFPVIEAYSHRASALTLWLTFAVTLGKNTLLSIATITSSVSVNVNRSAKNQVGFILVESVKADGWCEQTFNAIVYASRSFYVSRKLTMLLLTFLALIFRCVDGNVTCVCLRCFSRVCLLCVYACVPIMTGNEPEATIRTLFYTGSMTHYLPTATNPLIHLLHRQCTFSGIIPNF